MHGCTSRSRGGAQGADSDGTTEGSIARRGVDETAMHCGTEEHRVESIQAGQREEWHSESLAKKRKKNLWLVWGEKTKGMWDATTIPASTTTQGVGRGEDTNNTGGVRVERRCGGRTNNWSLVAVGTQQSWLFALASTTTREPIKVMCCHKCRTCKNWIRTHLERHFS